MSIDNCTSYEITTYLSTSKKFQNSEESWAKDRFVLSNHGIRSISLCIRLSNFGGTLIASSFGPNLSCDIRAQGYFTPNLPLEFPV